MARAPAFPDCYATAEFGGCYLEDASAALGVWGQKFYSCTAIEKKQFSLCGR
jgi:hypothetical protein